MKVSEFEILGHQLKFNPQHSTEIDNASGDDFVAMPEQIIELAKKEIDLLGKKNPTIGQEKLFLLTILKLASDKLCLENEYRQKIKELKETAAEALEYVESLKSH